MKRKTPAELTSEFEAFVTSAAGDLLRTAYLVLFDHDAAEDVVQECLVKVARRWPRIASMEYPAAYARRILVRDAIRGAGRSRRQRQELQPNPRASTITDDPGAERAFRVVDARLDLVPALRNLPTRQRAVLVLRYFNDLTEAETADALGCSTGTVKSTTSRALDRLRLQLGPDASNPTPELEGVVSHDPARD